MDDLGTNGPGNVYVFNVNSQAMNLSLNGLSIAAGGIPGWSQSGGSPYQPAGGAVPRTLDASDGPGKFCNGANYLTIVWPNGMFEAQIRIDGSQTPLNQDLMVFVGLNQWQLLNQYAIQIGSGAVNAAGFNAVASERGES